MTYAIAPTADMQLDSPVETQHWRPLVNWLLAIPHLVIANALGNLANILSVISWFSIVFTGRMPDGIARFQCMILRYEARAYSYVAFLRRPYPVFEFDMTNSDPSTDPLRVDFASPTSFVSIDALSTDSFAFGFLEAFDSGGNLLASFWTMSPKRSSNSCSRTAVGPTRPSPRRSACPRQRSGNGFSVCSTPR